jgi:spore germination protein GerM
VASVAVAGAVLAGCGIPADDEPRAVSPEQLPTSTTTLPSDGEDETRAVDLWFVRFDGERDVLTPVEREIPLRSESGQPTPASVLDALLSGVLADEGAEASIVTKIPHDTALAGQPVLENGTLTVDLGRGISGVQGDGSRLAYGQMVCTAEGLAGVEDVEFLVEGEPVQPLDGNGQVSSAPLTCASYENLIGG